MRYSRVVACAAYAEGALDSQKPEAAASSLGIELLGRKVSRESLSAALEEMDLPFEPTKMDMSLWCLYYLVARTARDAGAKVLLLGQLADELFGGYAKYSQALRSSGETCAISFMVEDQEAYFARGKVRDFNACRGVVRPKLPFESEVVRSFASEIPMTFKIRDGVRKAILRRAAVLLGVPDELASAPKKAAQYSSGIQKLVVRSHF
jgi:asparagine synthase (glutamine-hydrolysing)